MMNYEQAQQVNSSREWELVVKEIEFRIQGTLAQLRNCKQEELRELQLRLQFLEEIKRLPGDVKEREEGSAPDQP